MATTSRPDLGFLHDEPTPSPDARVLAERLVRRFARLPTLKPRDDLKEDEAAGPLKYPFATAIYGAWGSGKTSLLRALKHEFEGQATIVEFEPWRYEK